MLSLNTRSLRLSLFVPPLLVATWFVSGCLSMVFEEERDLSDFESFRLEGDDCDCFEFEIAAAEDGTPSIAVRFEGELWKTRDLTGEEIGRLRELSEKVVLEEVIFTELITGHGCSRCVHWDDLEACSWGSSKYSLSIQTMERFETLMRELGGVE